jgi:hypothetical protein
VWYDINGNGLQDSGEPGLAGVRVSLRIEYPDGTQIDCRPGPPGIYRFANLLLDPRYAESTTNDPSVAGRRASRCQWTPSSRPGRRRLLADAVGAGGGTNDSRNPAGTFAVLRKGGRPVDYDFGYSRRAAAGGDRQRGSRRSRATGRPRALGDDRIVGHGGLLARARGGRRVGAHQPRLLPFPLFGVAPIVYEEVDPGAAAGGTYLYRLVELENDGDEPVYGPYELTVDGPGRTYDDWAAGNFAPGDVADPAISGPRADPDGDGLTNWQEFLAWTDPQARDSVLQLTEARPGFRTASSCAGRAWRGGSTRSRWPSGLAGPFLPLEASRSWPRSETP